MMSLHFCVAGILLLAVIIVKGQALIFLNPLKCHKTELKTIQCIVSRLDTTNSTLYSLQDMVPKDTIDLTLRCVILNNNTLLSNTFTRIGRNLQHLTFQSCRFRYLPFEGFFGLSNLRSLTFCSLKDRVKFMDHEKLYDKYGNGLPDMLLKQNISTQFMCSLVNLRNLTFSQYGMRNLRSILPCSATTCCSNLISLNFSSNFISHIEVGVLSGLQNLKVLDLSANNILFLPKEIFSKLISLTVLMLSDNPLNQISLGLFGKNVLLSQLALGYHNDSDMAMNEYSNLDAINFEFPKSLMSLSMKALNLGKFSARVFNPLLNLRQLLLWYPDSHRTNPDTTNFINLALKKLTYLTDLVLNYNVTIYPKTFENLKHLKLLTLINCLSLLNLLEIEFVGLNQLEILNIENLNYNYDKMRRKDKILPGLNHLKTLNIKGMDFKHYFNHSYDELISLRIIRLNFCSLELVPKGICNRSSASNLTEMYLNDNIIMHLLKSYFEGCDNLKTLDLSHNLLEYICEKSCARLPDAKNLPFSTLSKLTHLVLAKNHIKNFDFSFIPIGLIHLDLSYNYISSLTDISNIRDNLSLKSFNLNQNRLFSYGGNIFPPSITTLFLGNNEFIHGESEEEYDEKRFQQLEIQNDAFSNSKKLEIVIFDHTQDLKIERQSLTNHSSTVGTFFHIEWVDKGSCPGENNQDLYPAKDPGCDILSRNLSSYKVVSYYNNVTKTHHYCQYKQECGYQWFRNQPKIFPKCDRIKAWLLNELDCGNSGFQGFPFQFPREFLIQNLLLDGNNLSRIPSNAFASLHSSLRVLYLNFSHISEIDINAFAKLTNLRELHLADNIIFRIMEPLVPIAVTLTFLNLSNNRISTINEDKVYDGTSLQRFPTEKKIRWHNLTELYLDNNSIRNLDSLMFLYFKNLQKLVLHDNFIQEIKPFAVDIEHLEILDLSNNIILFIQQNSFHRMLKLATLDLHGNKIGEINRSEFRGLEGLLNLALNNNKIRRIAPGTFVDSMNLKILHLNANCLSELNGEEFNGLSKLEELNLANNNLTRLHNKTFSSLKALKKLTLSGNRIKKLHLNLFSQVNRLEVLYLDHNFIQIISGHFNTTSKLRQLYLTHNLLSTLQLNIYEGLSNLAVLVLNNNSLKNPEVWKLPSSITTLYLTNNPLTCDCKFISDFLRWFTNIGISKLQNVESITCMKSDTLEKVQIQRFDSSDCRVTYEVLLGVCSVMLFLLFVVVCVLYYWRLEVQVWVYSRYGLRLFYKTEDDDNSQYDVFIAYSSDDEDFVVNNLMPGLNDYRVCVHYRDFPAGAYITEAVMAAVERSSRSLLVFSPQFVRSPWCSFEFKAAHYRALHDRCCRLILIILEDVNEELLDLEQRAYLRTNTYLRWDDSLFWQKLRFALPNLRPDAPVQQGLLQIDER